MCALGIELFLSHIGISKTIMSFFVHAFVQPDQCQCSQCNTGVSVCAFSLIYFHTYTHHLIISNGNIIACIEKHSIGPFAFFDTTAVVICQHEQISNASQLSDIL